MGKLIRPFCWHHNFVPGGCLPLPRGYIHVLNHEKKCIKSDFKESFFKLATNEWSARLFCWHQNFVPWGLSTAAPGLYTCIKSWKNVYNQTSKRFLWNLQQMGKVIRPFCRHQTFVPWGLSAPAPAPGLYTCIKSWKNCIKSDFKEFVLKPATNEWSDKTFLLPSKLCHLGAVCPCPGTIHMY